MVDRKRNRRLGSRLCALGAYGFVGVLKGVTDLSHVTPERSTRLSQDLTVIFQYLHQQGFGGFNLALFLPVGSPTGMQAHVRVIRPDESGPHWHQRIQLYQCTSSGTNVSQKP